MTTLVGRVAEVVAPRTSVIREEAFPPPGPGQVLVKVLHTGVCASDLPSWLAGPHPGQAPIRLGHEPVGVIQAIGAGTTHLQPDQVVTGRLAPSLADYVYADPVDIVAVPLEVDPAVAIGEPLGCTIEGYRRAPPPVGASTAVVGVGFMGLVMTKLLTLSPVASIWAIDPRHDARTAAANAGATQTLTPDDSNLAQAHADFVVEASGTQSGLDLASAIVKEHGVLSILGYHQTPNRTFDLRSWNWKALDIVNAHVRNKHLLAANTQAALRLLAAKRLSIDDLITHRFTLDQLDDAYTALHEKPPGFLKAIVTL